MAPTARPHVVILGGGFAGLYCARALRRAPVRITLVDRRNHHLFQPLLYQVATAGLSAPQVATAIRQVFRHQKNTRVLLAEAERVDVDQREVHLDGGDVLAYDYLVVATGATHSYFGNDQWAEQAPGLKTVEDAFEIRQRVLLAYERAERDTEDREALLTFAVVGGGPTGVELAGALVEMSRHTLRGEYRDHDPARARVLLLEGADRLLGSFAPELSDSARKQLERLGVEVRTNARVTHIDEDGVRVGDERIAARTVLWAAGVQASPLAHNLGAELDRAGRVLVTPELALPDHPEVFVCGDLAAARHGEGWVPGVAQGAIQGGLHAARSILRALAGKPATVFRYRDKGSLATIGRNRAVAQVGSLKFSGFWAWLLWAFIHVAFLIGFRNRLMVMWDWTSAWFSYTRSARLIFKKAGD